MGTENVEDMEERTRKRQRMLLNLVIHPHP